MGPGILLRARWVVAVPAVVVVVASAPAARQASGPPSQIALDEAAAAAAEMPRLRSLLVSWQGSLVLERYFNGARADRLANVKSVSKSVLSALIGIAVDRGVIAGIHEDIAGYFPDVLRDADPAKRQITIEDLLTMRSGLEPTSNRNYGAWVRSSNWVRYVLTRPLVSEPGTGMEYSTGNTHVLSAILTKATRSSTWAFGQEALARPLGFSLARWPTDPQGVFFGGNDMLLTPRQMLAFGELYLNRGRANGRQVVPEPWIDTSLVPRTRSSWSDQQYGYGWWIRDIAGHRAHYAWGFGGQFIIVVPALELVVVTTSAATVSDDRRSHRRNIYDLIEQLVVSPIAATHSTPPPAASASR